MRFSFCGLAEKLNTSYLCGFCEEFPRFLTWLRFVGMIPDFRRFAQNIVRWSCIVLRIYGQIMRRNLQRAINERRVSECTRKSTRINENIWKICLTFYRWICIMVYVVGDKSLLIIKCSEVAQWWSRRLLTARSRVRAPPSEPFLSRNVSVLAGVAELADAQDLKSCDPYRSYRFDPGLRHQYFFDKR